MAQIEWKEVSYHLPAWKAETKLAEYESREAYIKDRFTSLCRPKDGSYRKEFGLFPSIEEAQEACQDWEDEHCKNSD